MAYPEGGVDATVLDFVADLSLDSPGHPLLCDFAPGAPFGDRDLVPREGRRGRLAGFEEVDPGEEGEVEEGGEEEEEERRGGRGGGEGKQRSLFTHRLREGQMYIFLAGWLLCQKNSALPPSRLQ